VKHLLSIGDKHHHWTIIQPGTQNSTARCVCGEDRVMRNWNITNGKPKQCINCYHKEKITTALIPIGTVLNGWVVISDRYEHKESKTGGLKQEVQCKCGYIRFLELSPLKCGRTKKCLMCSSRDRLEVHRNILPIRYAKRIEYEAKRRGLIHELSLDHLCDKYEEQNGLCALSGLTLYMPLINISRYEKANKYVNTKNFTASLDRIDSSKGYIVGNVQWVHKDVNKMKMDLQEEDFFRIIKEIYEHKQLNKQ
jgi:hypothetical protein